MKITPILYVKAIEPCLPFWVDSLGFEKTVEVPEGDRLGFVILVKPGLEVMIQTLESVKKDNPAILESLSKSSVLFIEVDDFDATLRCLNAVEVVSPVRTTFYGMKEILIREPGGNLLCFAAPARETASAV